MVREEPELGNKLQGMRDDPPRGENNNGAAYRSLSIGVAGAIGGIISCNQHNLVFNSLTPSPILPFCHPTTSSHMNPPAPLTRRNPSVSGRGGASAYLQKSKGKRQSTLLTGRQCIAGQHTR
ncbi:hypothetical protein CRENBAI_026210 [Crenichthys baileyi]|uniref:Uncharacterized protein n=1 Tax=Crenichthys baileyi TaxID=28760 RepID=A0AAV9QQK6_9TELE